MNPRVKCGTTSMVSFLIPIPCSLIPRLGRHRTPLNILFVGDIFGSAGRRIVREHIGHVREAHNVELTIINVENAAGGFGVTPQIAEELFDLGADVLTTGNHVWDKRELLDYLRSVPADSQERARRILRPANMQPGLPGYGVLRRRAATGPDKGLPYAVMNLMGKVFMSGTNDPFHAANDLLVENQGKGDCCRFSCRGHQRESRHGLAPGWQRHGGAGHAYAHSHGR